MIAANAISRFGDSIDVIAYSWLIYEVTGSASWLAVLVGVNMLPTVLLQPFMGVLASFVDKKKMVVRCDIARGALVCATGGCMLFGVLNIGLLIAFTLFNSCFEALRVPCGVALLSRILQKEHYKVALSFNQGVSRAMELIGLGASGMVIAALGTGGALLVDAATFLLSAVLLSCMRVRADETRESDAAPDDGIAPDGALQDASESDMSAAKLELGGYFRHLKEGFGYFRASRVVILLCFLCAILNVVLIPVENLNVAFVKEYLQLGLFTVSAGSGCLTVGTILGALCYPIVSRGVRVYRFICVGGLVIAVLYGAFVCAGPGLVPLDTARTMGYALLCFVFGCINSMLGMAVQIHFVTSLPEKMLGRIGGLFNAVVCSSVPVASFVISGVVRFVPIQGLFLGIGALSFGVFAVRWFTGKETMRAE